MAGWGDPMDAGARLGAASGPAIVMLTASRNDTAWNARIHTRMPERPSAQASSAAVSAHSSAMTTAATSAMRRFSEEASAR